MRVFRSGRWFAAMMGFGLLLGPSRADAQGFTPGDFQRAFPDMSRAEIRKKVEQLRKFLPRIIGGEDAKPGEFPYQVSLMFSSNYDSAPAVERHFCGGSIIGDEWVMTAAHCVAGMTGAQKYFSIGSGAIDLDKLEEYELDGIWIHPNYDGGSLDYDFAIIKVKNPFFDPEIAVVDRDDNQHIAVGTTATITGWGVDASGQIQQILKKADVQVISRADCNDADSYNGTVTSRMICLGLEKGGKDTCQGDSGGPAAARVEGGARVLFATTSWGHGCAEPEKFGVYGRLIAVRDWIDGIVLRGEQRTARNGR
jgi:secreted trypsin-like serine protease